MSDWDWIEGAANFPPYSPNPKAGPPSVGASSDLLRSNYLESVTQPFHGVRINPPDISAFTPAHDITQPICRDAHWGSERYLSNTLVPQSAIQGSIAIPGDLGSSFPKIEGSSSWSSLDTDPVLRLDEQVANRHMTSAAAFDGFGARYLSETARQPDFFSEAVSGVAPDFIAPSVVSTDPSYVTVGELDSQAEHFRLRFDDMNTEIRSISATVTDVQARVTRLEGTAKEDRLLILSVIARCERFEDLTQKERGALRRFINGLTDNALWDVLKLGVGTAVGAG